MPDVQLNLFGADHKWTGTPGAECSWGWTSEANPATWEMNEAFRRHVRAETGATPRVLGYGSYCSGEGGCGRRVLVGDWVWDYPIPGSVGTHTLCKACHDAQQETRAAGGPR